MLHAKTRARTATMITKTNGETAQQGGLLWDRIKAELSTPLTIWGGGGRFHHRRFPENLIGCIHFVFPQGIGLRGLGLIFPKISRQVFVQLPVIFWDKLENSFFFYQQMAIKHPDCICFGVFEGPDLVLCVQPAPRISMVVWGPW